MNTNATSFASKAFAFFALNLILFATGITHQVAGQSRELSLADILIALRSKKAVLEEKNKILVDAVKERGVTFTLTPEIERELSSAGARAELIAAIRERAPKPVIATGQPMNTQLPPPAAVTAPPPPDFAFYRSQATQEIRANNLDAALAALDKAIELKPGDAGSYVDKGIILSKKGQHEAAIEQYTKAVELNENYAFAYYSRGVSKEKLGKREEALADYQKSHQLDPSVELTKSTISRLKAELAEAEAAARAKAAQAEAAAKAEARAKASEAKAPEEVSRAETPQRPQVVNAGALNAYAIKLSMPVYTINEKRRGIHGKVTVSIKLNEEGKVVSAKAIDGPKQLWVSAENAIKLSKFKPVLFEGKPIAATGYITFNFTLD